MTVQNQNRMTTKMAQLVIGPMRKQFLNLPHYLLINDQLLGMMKGQDVRLNLPEGQYRVTIRSAYKFIESSMIVNIVGDKVSHLSFGDRERLWNILFNIDLVLWIFKRFVHFSSNWDLMYEIVSNGFFAIWLLRIWLIRKNYFKLEVTTS